jgi:hypothetical protein
LTQRRPVDAGRVSGRAARDRMSMPLVFGTLEGVEQ